MKKLLIVCTALALFADPLYAQTATTNTIDISPITTQLIQIVGVVLSGIAVWAGVWLKSWLASKSELANSQFAESLQARYNEAIARGMAYAEAKAQDSIPGGGKIKIDNEFVREAAQYVIDLWPDLTKTMNMEGIAKSVIARLPTGTFTATAEAIANRQPAPEVKNVVVAASAKEAAEKPGPAVDADSAKT